MLQITSIKNGFMLDHIKAEYGMYVRMALIVKLLEECNVTNN